MPENKIQNPKETSPENDNAMTIDERNAVINKYGMDKIKEYFEDYIVNRTSHPEVCKKHGLGADEFDEILRVCFYALDEAGNNAVDAMESQKTYFDAVYNQLGKGTQSRIKKAMKRMAGMIDSRSFS